MKVTTKTQKTTSEVAKVEKKASTATKEASEGVIYKRTNVKTGGEYIGQAKSDSRYEKRQAEHARANMVLINNKAKELRNVKEKK